MQFYELKRCPVGDADTYFSQEEGSNFGNAEQCPVCNAFVSTLTWLPPFRVEVTLYGKEFGDLAFGPGIDFLVSQKFREAYYQGALTGLHGFDPVEVISVKSENGRRLSAKPPMYFRVNITRGAAMLDHESSEFTWDEPPTCPKCKSGIVRSWKRLVLKLGTWTGEDALRPWGINRALVTQQFKDACQRHGITNAVFIPAEEAGQDYYGPIPAG